MEYPVVVQAWKETNDGKKHLAGFTVVDDDDEFESFKLRWPDHILTKRPLNNKEKKARGLEDRKSWFSKLFG